MMLLILSGDLLAQEMKSLPIGSKDLLRTYAIEQSSQITAQIGTTIPTGGDRYQYTSVLKNTAAGISNTIAGMLLSIDVANPNDWIYVYNAVYNEDGDTLFSGSKHFKLENGKGGYALSVGYGDVPLNLSHTVPIKVDAVRYAYISIMGENGQTQQMESVEVRDGKIYFPRSLAGENAILSLLIGDEWHHWSVQNGSYINPEHFNINLTSGIEGISSFKDQNVIVRIQTKNGVGKNQTAEVEVTGKSLITASFFTNEGKWFQGAWVRKAGATELVYYPAVVDERLSMMLIHIPVQAGVYYIIPDWHEADLVEPEDPYYPPYDGGGGGKG